MKRLEMLAAAALAAFLCAPLAVSADASSTLASSWPNTAPGYGPSYGLGGPYGHTAWRGYNQGAMADGFDCHKVQQHATDGTTTVIVESTQCYDRNGNAYLVPDGSTIIRLDEITIISMPSELLFAFDSAEISPESRAHLEETAAMIRESGATTVTIVGHTDGIGRPEYNQQLSLRRADAVRDWLVNEGGLTDVDFQVSGVGATEPRFQEVNAEGDDIPEARQANRRVEIIYSSN